MTGRFNLDGSLRNIKECLTDPESSDLIGSKSNISFHCEALGFDINHGV
jgi:hypothetical protein